MPTSRLVLALGSLFLVLSQVACASPSWVEGTVEDRSFTLSDDGPELRASATGTRFLLAEEDGAELRLIEIRLPPVAELSEGDVLTIEPGLATPSLKLVVGPLEIIERSDGVRVLNTTAPRTWPARSGTFTVDSLDPLAVSFDVELDGGSLSGSAVASEG